MEMAMNSGKTVLSGIVEKVAFVNKWPMLMKATSDDDVPTPGYMYKEITDLSYASSGFCSSLLDFLVDRLDKASFHIKVKVLKILKHVVDNGHGDFKVGLRRQAKGIQNAIKFSGNPDPLHGNAPYIAVRQAAMELNEILFDTEHIGSPKKQTAAINQNKIQGFGNTPTHQPHLTRSLSDVIKGGVEQLASNLTNPQTSLESTSTTDYRPINGCSMKGQRSQVSRPQYGRSSVNSGGTASDYNPVDISDVGQQGRVGNLQGRAIQYTPSGSWENQNIVTTCSKSIGSNDSSGKKSAASMDMSEKLASVAVEDWSQEIKLVEDFISSNNTKATLSRMELGQFTKRCTTSSCEKVLELLDHKLTNQSQPTMQMRGLCAIEAIIREDFVSVERAQGILQTNLQLLFQSGDNLVQAKAKKISRQLERLVQEINEDKKTRSPLHQISMDSVNQIRGDNLVNYDQNTELLAGLAAPSPTPQSSTLELTTPSSDIRASTTQSKQLNSLFSGMSIGQGKQNPDGGDDPFGLKTEFTGNEITSSELTGSEPAGSALTGSEFTGSSLIGNESTGIKLTGSELTGSSLIGSEFTGSALSNQRNLQLDVESQNHNRTTPSEMSNVIDEQTRPGEPIKMAPEMSLLASEPIKETMLDTILDLSSTEQATLEPISDNKTLPSASSQLLGLSGGAGCTETRHVSTPKSQMDCLSAIKPEKGYSSTLSMEMPVHGKPLSKADSVQSSTTFANVPEAKRVSHRDNILASIDPLSKSTKPMHENKTSSSSADVSSANTIVSTNTVGGIDLGLYPQLSMSHLSGMSAVPLNLSSNSQKKNFAFVETEDDKKEKRTKSGQEDVFGFVNDAIAKAGGKT